MTACTRLWTVRLVWSIICAEPAGDAIMDLGEWLRGLGLGQYETSFHENGVDAEVLPDLSECADLKAIAGLSSVAGEPVSGRPAAKPEPKPHDAAERCQLTVMFCDLVGSTAMSARLDPEDMRAIIAAYHKCCASLIEQNGGFVAKYMGDGVLAYFGYFQAHEHDGERAVRADLRSSRLRRGWRRPPARRCMCEWGSRPGSSSSAISWVLERRRSAGSWAIHRTSRRGFRVSPSPTTS